METETELFEVGDLNAAVCEGEWLLVQVDIDQDHTSDTHGNLAYMERGEEPVQVVKAGRSAAYPLGGHTY
jgi:hypothetical protein